MFRVRFEFGESPLTPEQYGKLVDPKTEQGHLYKLFFDGFREDAYGAIGKTIIPANVAAHIREYYPYVIVDNVFYIYRNGVFEQDTKKDSLMTYIINNLLPPIDRTKNRANEVINQLKADPGRIKRIDEMNDHPVQYICFQNGVFDPVTGKMLQHDPKYLFLNQIPHTYEPDKPLPKGDIIESFFDSIRLSAENRKMLLSFSGLCMTTDTGLQRFLVFKGLPNTGKSTMLNLIRCAVGAKNCTSRELERLSDPKEKFYAYGLVGKTCNIGADLVTESVIDPTMMKKLTGEDEIAVEPKGVDAYEITPYAKHIFAMNGYPQVRSKDNAFFRRPLLIPFNHIPEIAKDNLKTDLASQVDYFIRLCMDSLTEYYRMPNKQEIESGESKRMREQWQQRGDSVAAFLADSDPFDGAERMERTRLYLAYEQYCKDEGREKPFSKPGFYESMRDKGYIETKYNGDRCFRNPDYTGEFMDADSGSPFDDDGEDQ